jgi:hypothetical protein
MRWWRRQVFAEGGAIIARGVVTAALVTHRPELGVLVFAYAQVRTGTHWCGSG